MQISIRSAVHTDSQLLFNWRNDEATRSASLNTAVINFEDHAEWFDRALSNRDIFIFIAECLGNEDEQIGTTRFEIDEKSSSATVSINLAPGARGLGLSGEILEGSMVKFQELVTTPIRLHAQVRVDNLASLRLFAKAGFYEVEQKDSIVYLDKELEARTIPSQRAFRPERPE